MKRILAVLIIVVTGIAMAGCAPVRYMQAQQLYGAEQYGKARLIYEELGDFADSARQAELCRQKADYAAAEEHLAAGEYEQAAALFEGLGPYSDSPLRAVLCRYRGGRTCIAEKEYARAIDLLIPLGGYEDSAELVRMARWQWLGEISPARTLRTNGEGMLSIEAAEEGLLLRLEKRGQILGLPWETVFTMTLDRENSRGEYMLIHTSQSASTITEKASGTVVLKDFSEGLPVADYSLVVTDSDKTVTESDQTAEAVMIRSVMTQVVAEIMEDLPRLLEESGVEITMEDLGF